MTEWREATLDQLVRLQRGHDLPSGKRIDGEVPVIGAAGPSGRHDRAIVKAPGVVIGRAGGSMGKATYCDVDFWPLNTALYVTDFLGNDPRFAYYLLDQIDFSGYNSGAAQPMLNRNYIAKIAIKIPHVELQKSISSLLGALDDKIAVNGRVLDAGESLLQEKFNQLGLGVEPDSDSAIPLTELFEFNPKIKAPSSEEPVYVDMAALSTRRSIIASWVRRPPKSGTRFTNGDTLFARITPCLENGKTGYVDFMEPGEVGLGSTEFIVIRSRSGIPPELSYFMARDQRFRVNALRNMVGSSGRQRVGASDVARLAVNRPDSDALIRFGDDARMMFGLLQSMARECRVIADLRDTLLPQLMSGKLRVRDAERIVEYVV